MSGLVNKIKSAVQSDKQTEQPEGTSGPHNSRVANAADPRVDSDRDHRAAHASNLSGGDAEYSTGNNYTTTHNPSATNDHHKSNLTDTGNSHSLGSHPQETSGTSNYNVTDSSRVGDKSTHHSTSSNTTSLPEGATGPHNSRIANTMDPRVDSDKDGSRTMGSSGHTGAHSVTNATTPAGVNATSRSTETREGATGPHNSRIANAADPRVDSDRDGSRTMGSSGHTGTHSHTTTTTPAGVNTTLRSAETREGATGPHNSRIANAADPRVDSDRDGSRAMGSSGHTGTYGHTTTTPVGVNSSSRSSEAREGVTGPHNSRIANAADPRVDSDRDGSRTMGSGSHAGHHGDTTTGRTGAHTTTSHSTGTQEGATGPHNSRIANAADPRVDSDRDGSRTMGSGGHTRTHGHTTTTPVGVNTTSRSTETREGATGPHNSRIANAADPRVDSDRDGSRTMGSGGHTGTSTTPSKHHEGAAGHSSLTSNPEKTSNLSSKGPGPAPSTAGPHKSDLLNKLDPRVDSNLDGSKTLGRDKTFDS